MDKKNGDQPATPLQHELLASKGYHGKYTKQEASDIICNLPANEKQVKAMERWGYDVSKGVTILEFRIAALKHLPSYK